MKYCHQKKNKIVYKYKAFCNLLYRYMCCVKSCRAFTLKIHWLVLRVHLRKKDKNKSMMHFFSFTFF